MSTAPHQPRKKRELTRAVETLTYKNGGRIGSSSVSGSAGEPQVQ